MSDPTRANGLRGGPTGLRGRPRPPGSVAPPSAEASSSAAPTASQTGAAARPMRGMVSLRGTPSLRGASTGRMNIANSGPSSSSSSSTASMIPSRSSYASAPFGSGVVPASGVSPAPVGMGARMQFRPVMPQRRKPTDIEIKPEPVTPSLSESSERGRGRGGRGGLSRNAVELTASGPFALGPTAKLNRSRTAIAPIGPGGSKLTSTTADPNNESGGLFSLDPHRATYRNPDKLKDAEQYSDPEDDGVDIIDMDQVHVLDDLAPRALPRVQAKQSKKEKKKAAEKKKKKVQDRIKAETVKVGTVKIKPDPDDQDQNLRATTVSSGTDTPPPPLPLEEEDSDKEEIKNNKDALDLSESEEEELMDDLVDDFVFNQDDDDSGVSPENKLYLFQFPNLFPKFVTSSSLNKQEENNLEIDSKQTIKDQSLPQSILKKRSVAFAQDIPSSSSSEDEDEEENNNNNNIDRGKPANQGQMGKLDVYRDGRVFFRFNDLVMEVTGGSQSTFLQQVMTLDSDTKTATTLGEVYRKFIVTPDIDNMLNDFSLYDQEQRRKQQQQQDDEEIDRK